MIGKEIEELFAFDKYAMYHFERKIKEMKEKENYFMFDFVLNDLNQNHNYVIYSQMKFIFYPTIDLNEVLILAAYAANEDNCIVCELTSQNEEIIVSYSYSYLKDIVFPPSVINFLNSKYKYILFEKIVRQITLATTTTLENKHDEEKSYYFSYSQYNKLFRSYIKYLNENNNYLDESFGKTQKIFNRLYEELPKHDPLHKRILKLKSRIVYDAPNRNSIVIYSFSKEIKNNVRNANVIGTTEFGTFLDFNREMTGSTANHYSNIVKNSNSSMLISGSVDDSTFSGKSNQELFKKYEQEKKNVESNYQHFTFFTYLILFLNIILIALSLVYLVLQINYKSSLLSTFFFFGDFAEIERLFMTIPFFIFFNQCPAKQGQRECHSYIKDFSLLYINKYNLSDNFLIYDYIYKDIYFRTNMTFFFLIDFRTSVMNSKIKKLISVANEEFDYKYISVVGNDLTVKSTKRVFFEAITAYITAVKDLVETNTVISTPMHFISIKGDDIDLSNIILVHPYENTQINLYNLMINFMSIYYYFDKLHITFAETINSYIHRITNIINIFTFLFVVFHLIVFSICLMLLFLFEKILDSHFFEYFWKLNNKKLMTKFNAKIDILQIMIFLYRENPNTLLSSINKIKSDYNRINTQKESTKTTQTEKQKLELSSNTKIVKQSTKALFTYSYRIIYFPLIFFIVVTFIYYVFLRKCLSSYDSLLNSAIENSRIDGTIYSMSTAFEIMLKTNQTNKELSNSFLLNEDGFIHSKVKNNYKLLEYIEKIEKKHPKIVKPLKSVFNLTCEITMNATIGKMGAIIEKMTPNLDLTGNLVKLCNGLEVLKYKDEKYILKDILYRLIELSNELNEATTYDELYEINAEENVFDYFVLILLFYRPIRNYQSRYVSPVYISVINADYSKLIYSFLIVLFVFEVSLFFIIKECIIKKFIRINKALEMSKKCFKL